MSQSPQESSFRSHFTRYAAHYSATIMLAVPVMFTQIGHMIVQITDNIMVGRLGTVPLAASSFGHNVFIAGLLFCIGFSAAMTPFVGAAKGKGDSREAASWLKNGFLANILMATLVTGLMAIVGLFLDNMGQKPDVVRLARPFYLWMILSILPVAVFQSFKQFSEGLGNTRVAAMITVQEIIINIGLNYVLINGKFGFPALGVTGSGVATFVARCSMMLTFSLIFLRSEFYAPYRAAMREVGFDKTLILRYIRLGIPLGGQTILEVAAFALGAIMMGWLGATELAAHQIAMGAAALTFMGATGISAAATIRVSQFYGAKDRVNMRSAGFAASHVVLAYMSLSALAFVMFRYWIPTIYIQDAAVIQMAAGLLMIAALFQIFDGLQTVMLGTLRALADARIPTIIAFVAYIVVSLPISYGAAFLLGWREIGIWTGYLAGLTVASTFFYLRFYRRSRTIPFV
ncbi:MAG: MATE family efflux transporter [Candidatus Kapabacteria bacterium]|jgi:MATE family multidrug resistance protein|nr:MATE family efflux transporter [Candidatus Kapabacteria bacterium]